MSVVLITGAAKRLGRAIALKLADGGYDVAIHYRGSKLEAESLAAEITKMGRRAALVDGDLSDEASAQTIVPRASSALGPVTALVNSASVFEDDRVDTATRASWDKHLNTNLRAPFVLAQAFAKQLPTDAHGAIVNLIDQAVLNLTPQFMSYTVSKAALWTLTQTLAQALAPRIRVNGVAPGPSLKAEKQSQANFDAHVKATLLQRPSAPQDIAGAVHYLLTAPAVTGQLIAVDSGQHLAWSRDQFFE
ncbi:MAG: SDR family oxidoreductase [Alphaproteobacteria bacterium]|nr:SDR family oxidoreductase [Alphaproteobacteria bacterium]